MAENEYRAYVDERLEEARKSPSKVISNEDPQHAAVVWEVLFESADKEVDILAPSLPTEIFDKQAVIDAAKRLLNERAGKIRMLLECEPPPCERDLPLVKAVSSEKKHDRVEIRYVPDQLRGLYNYSFARAGARKDDSKGDDAKDVKLVGGYRLVGDRRGGSAFAQFGASDMGRRLAERFQKIWDVSYSAEESTVAVQSFPAE